MRFTAAADDFFAGLDLLFEEGGGGGGGEPLLVSEELLALDELLLTLLSSESEESSRGFVLTALEAGELILWPVQSHKQHCAKARTTCTTVSDTKGMFGLVWPKFTFKFVFKVKIDVRKG